MMCEGDDPSSCKYATAQRHGVAPTFAVKWSNFSSGLHELSSRTAIKDELDVIDGFLTLNLH